MNDYSDNLSRINTFEWNEIFIKTFLQVYYNCSKHGSQPDQVAVQITQKPKGFVCLFWGRFLVKERRDSNEATSKEMSHRYLYI